jgi:hypothetical protein
MEGTRDSSFASSSWTTSEDGVDAIRPPRRRRRRIRLSNDVDDCYEIDEIGDGIDEDRASVASRTTRLRDVREFRLRLDGGDECDNDHHRDDDDHEHDDGEGGLKESEEEEDEEDDDYHDYNYNYDDDDDFNEEGEWEEEMAPGGGE